MRVSICAVGRCRTGPEKALLDDYATRFDRTGRALGLGPLSITEVEDRKGGGMAGEAALLSRALPDKAHVIALDERGKLMTSPAFAELIARLRDDGTSDLAFVIGGADGIAPDLRARTDGALSFGKMVWPHMLARVMLTEQLYRAASILAGSPYHRA
ncbi:23S rRNA (pseudouridine(1915)-N(3))-methyltransferase RlmH [Rhodalgimonas zhirmunskyi]|uniref:Ribosomal RNA large subunit methyltransferase H n=1 Tax=Rhodalgimonas zhirmunskyi TaxID=2964767 RepID=A0AAJ1X749_9RHOB|nr:23S rRNA (pseudouridine(1915)-N(3))-methyltransferase RlmH [Rhodoalgimonas zhirmunskyi]MDQ2095884.1 23S rRNA (pseudouridine(1915)-N(3))-methyltransferase RlmH [Rhodoalgimonas zhirmunskyi]